MLLLLTFCSPTETVTEEEVPEEEVEEEVDETIEPDWYSSRTTSSADSLYFKGYSHATATDTTEAKEIADEMALVNLRFEIDKFVDEAREGLAENSDADRYESPEFIIQLRNTIESLDLTDAQITHHITMTEDEVIHVFSKIESETSSVIDKLQSVIDDDQLKNSLSEKK